MNRSPSASLSDSPWFWLFLFGGTALLSLLVIGPKYQVRQAKLERKAQGRQEAWRLRQDRTMLADDVNAAPRGNAPGSLRIPNVALGTLAGVLAIGLAVALVVRGLIGHLGIAKTPLDVDAHPSK